MSQSLYRILILDEHIELHEDYQRSLCSSPYSEKLAQIANQLFDSQSLVSSSLPTWDLQFATRAREAFQHFQSAQESNLTFDLVIMDIPSNPIPGWNGIDIIRKFWEIDPTLSIVICTAQRQFTWERLVTALGTSDRLLILDKPFIPRELRQIALTMAEKSQRQRLTAARVHDLEQQLNAQSEEISQMSRVDRLTGLPNRTCLYDILEQAIILANKKPDFKFALHIMDVDRFKVINDSLGHDLGDELIQQIAQRICGVINFTPGHPATLAQSFLARLGGDEFAILQVGVNSPQQATQLAEQILHTLEAAHPLRSFQVHSSASLGIVCSTNGYDHAEDFVRDADIAMYRAKADGGSRYVLFTPQMHMAAMSRLTVETELRHALDKNEFTLVYQPIVSLLDRQLISVEALIRWSTPMRGTVSPGAFISLAEETGLIIPLGDWVLNEACRQVRAWQDQHHRTIPVSVNLSRRQLEDPNIVDRISSCLKRHDINPRLMSLEITESALMNNPLIANETLPRIKMLGVDLHMDDFGTGYSSLSCLHQFPLRTLKIDRTFINNANCRRDYAAVINAVIQLAHNLDMTVIAEGVETAAQAALLQSLDCDHAQGYYFSHPLPADKVLTFESSTVASLQS